MAPRTQPRSGSAGKLPWSVSLTGHRKLGLGASSPHRLGPHPAPSRCHADDWIPVQRPALSLRGAGCHPTAPAPGNPNPLPLVVSPSRQARRGGRPGAPLEQGRRGALIMGPALAPGPQGRGLGRLSCAAWPPRGSGRERPYLPAVSRSHFSNKAFRACAPDVRGSVCDLTSSRRRAWAVAGGDRGVTRGGLRRERTTESGTSQPTRAQGPPPPSDRGRNKGGTAAPGTTCWAGSD